MSFRKLIIVLFLHSQALMFSTGLNAGRAYDLKQIEDSLATIMNSMAGTRDDSTRMFLNEQFISIFREAIKYPLVDRYPFTRLKNLVKITPADSSFIIYQWNLQYTTGRFQYFGFIKLKNQEPESSVFLTDKSGEMRSADTLLLDSSCWFGALYYKIISCVDSNGKQYYTLLGWSGHSGLITRKVIEILRFDPFGRPVFGGRYFRGYNNGLNTRVIFLYDAASTMSLKYEIQPVRRSNTTSSGKQDITGNLSMENVIVFDRLVPIDPLLEGQFRYYIPSGDFFDGFRFESGIWNYLTNIDARNR